MTKRPNTSSPAPATLIVKRPRKAAGFRLARPTASGSQATSSYSSSLFLTVTPNEGRPGILARSRVITSDLETVEQTQSTIPTTNPQIQDSFNEITQDLIPDRPEAVASDTQEPTKKPKRKRETTNYVRPSKQCSEILLLINTSPGQTQRMVTIQKHFPG